MPGKTDERKSTLPAKRSSLPRLSSLASLQAFNPFARHRSNNKLSSDVTPSHSTSTVSLMQAASHADSVKTGSFDEQDASQIWSGAESNSSRRATHVSTSPIRDRWPPRKGSCQDPVDHSCQEIPRSKTPSNLPISIKSSANTTRSKAQLPRQESHPKLLSSRIPSPPTTTRKHSTTVSKILCANTPRLKRSETEPMLESGVERTKINERKRSARIFKENFRLSPTGMLSPMAEEVEKTDLYGSSPSLVGGVLRFTHTSQVDAQLVQDSRGDGSVSITKHKAGLGSASIPQNSPSICFLAGQSTPKVTSYRPPVQRWNSQPMINRHTTTQPQHSPDKIQQRRLVSEVQPATPQQDPKTSHMPMTSKSAGSQRLPSCGSHKSLPTPPSKKGFGEICSHEPIDYWAGRLMALCDRYRNEELMAVMSSSDSTDTRPDSSSSEQMHSAEAAVARQRRALEELYMNCTTEEAISSLVSFQSQIAAAQGTSELAKLLEGNQLDGPGPDTVSVDISRTDLVLGSSSARRKAFIDRLLGKSSIRVGRLRDTEARGKSEKKRLSWA